MRTLRFAYLRCARRCGRCVLGADRYEWRSATFVQIENLEQRKLFSGWTTIQDVQPPTLIAWTGTTFGIKARHVYRLEQRGDGTVVNTEESYEGLVARLLRGSLQKTLEKGLSDGLRSLKAEAERRPAV